MKGAVWIAFLLAVSASADPLHATLDRNEVQLGEPFHLRVSVETSPGGTVMLPAQLPLGDEFGEVQRAESRTKVQGRLRHSLDLTLVALALGDQKIPKLTLSVTDGAVAKPLETEELTVHVLSVVTDEKADLKPILPPVSIWQKDYTLLWVSGEVFAVLLAVLLIWRAVRGARKRAKVAAETARVDTRTAEEIALAKLDALFASGLLDPPDHRPFYFSVTEILREYLGRKFGFDALELTTCELLATLERIGGATGARMMGEVAVWLEECDLVKYANMAATRAQAEGVFERARGVIERLRVAFALEAQSQSAPPQAQPGVVSSAG